jgi:hypothetical protein
MTDAQKDAIVKAAQELVEGWRDYRAVIGGWRQSENLVSAVRAAEQPRWTVNMETFGTNVGRWGVIHDGREFWCYAADHDKASRIARLLNEDYSKT